jgi:hypothetical protein
MTPVARGNRQRRIEVIDAKRHPMHPDLVRQGGVMCQDFSDVSASGHL